MDRPIDHPVTCLTSRIIHYPLFVSFIWEMQIRWNSLSGIGFGIPQLYDCFIDSDTNEGLVRVKVSMTKGKIKLAAEDP